MKLKLTVHERLVLGMILPQQSNFTTLKVVTKIKDMLGFSEEEHKLLQFKYEGEEYIEEDSIKNTFKKKIVPPGGIHWEDTVPEKEFDIGEKATDIIKDALKELDENKKLGSQHMSLYEKFVMKQE